MKDLSVNNIINDCDGILIQGSKDIILDNFSTDTRTIINGDIFVGIKGEVFDGNTMYLEALKKGVKGCILNKDISLDKEELKKYPEAFIVLVSDTLKCLQTLAHLKRKLYDIPVVAITGSVGKTSTKDLVASVLETEFNVLKTEGNFNNHLGLPLTILKLKDHNMLVVEMGMNSLGEISALSKIAEPTLSLITNVGTAHIGKLGSRENILKAKLEILDGMQDKKIIINADNDLLQSWFKENKDNLLVITYGINNGDLRAYNIEMNEFNSKFSIDKANTEVIQINTPGEHFILNSLAAISVGKYFNISIENIQKGILNYHLSKRRMEIERIHDMLIINDCYNANYDSMVSALNYLGTLKGRKIAILGDMLELGEYSQSLHESLGEFILKNKIDILVTVGNYASFIAKKSLSLGFNKENILTYNDNKEAIKDLKNILRKDDNILIKASNGMHFMEIYEALKED